MMQDLPQSLIEAVRYFSDLGVCNKYMRVIKWPNGKPVCPHCDSDRIGEIATRRYALLPKGVPVVQIDIDASEFGRTGVNGIATTSLG